MITLPQQCLQGHFRKISVNNYTKQRLPCRPLASNNVVSNDRVGTFGFGYQRHIVIGPSKKVTPKVEKHFNVVEVAILQRTRMLLGVLNPGSHGIVAQLNFYPSKYMDHPDYDHRLFLKTMEF